ncbi:hypothetical protein F511_42177 [Dorcoceras hygrometricum]|uniref:Dystroglycan-like n=1 Tax=Dorcoceras hygrometricum TaxID=472368 RepID=A0A2Z7BB48_9LAMI|nr:hypothetical protein F511_42177 [Dorcoceras hygrometricum]
MASSLFVNTLQVDFTSVLTMEHAGMVRMFKTLKDTGLRGFLEATTPVFESAVVEYFSNSRVLAGTIVSAVCGQKLVVMEDIFSGTFKLPTQGMKNFYGIPTETISEMRTRFSATTVTFQSSGKKRDLLFEYRLLHDIVAKSLCAKAGSFDKVTCEKFEFMVAISAGISVNWGRILFQRLLAMVQTPRKQSQGFTVQLRLIAAGHRHHRYLAGLPLTSPECDFIPKFSPQSEIYHFTGTAQGSVLDAYQHVNQTAAHAPHEHQAQETEPQIQMPDHDTHDHDGKSSEDGVDPKINAIPISTINFEELPSTKQIVSPHPNPDFSTLRMIAITPQESSTLQLLHNATQSLNVISTHDEILSNEIGLKFEVKLVNFDRNMIFWCSEERLVEDDHLLEASR